MDNNNKFTDSEHVIINHDKITISQLYSSIRSNPQALTYQTFLLSTSFKFKKI